MIIIKCKTDDPRDPEPLEIVGNELKTIGWDVEIVENEHGKFELVVKIPYDMHGD